MGAFYLLYSSDTCGVLYAACGGLRLCWSWTNSILTVNNLISIIYVVNQFIYR